MLPETITFHIPCITFTTLLPPCPQLSFRHSRAPSLPVAQTGEVHQAVRGSEVGTGIYMSLSNIGEVQRLWVRNVGERSAMKGRSGEASTGILDRYSRRKRRVEDIVSHYVEVLGEQENLSWVCWSAFSVGGDGRARECGNQDSQEHIYRARHRTTGLTHPCANPG